MKQAVLYDFHGTLVNVDTVFGHLAERDFEGFYAGSLSCPPIDWMVTTARQSHRAGYRNILFTGMSDNYAEGLATWLALHDVPMDHIAMRKSGDRRKDFVVKHEMYIAALAEGFEVIRAYDDNPRCLDLWTNHGIPVVRVPGWREESIRRSS